MRSAKAAAFVFIWFCFHAAGAAATTPDFLQDCASVATDASPAMVLGRLGADGNRLVAAVGQSGIYRTENRGESWDLLTPAGRCHLPVESFWENTPEGDTLCVVTPARGDAHNTYCSFDGGAGWQAQTWIKDAVQVLFDPSDPARAFGWTPTNRCSRVCSGPTYGIAMSHAKSSNRLCACNMKLAHTAGASPQLIALRDVDDSGQNQLVRFTRDMERETVLFRESDPNVRMLDVYTNPFNEGSFLVTIARRASTGPGDRLCCDALYETTNNGRVRTVVPLLFGPLESVQFTNAYGDIATLVHPPHEPGVAYIGRKYFGTAEWEWSRAPEARGKLLAVDEQLYFAGKHLYRVDASPYVVIDPVY